MQNRNNNLSQYTLRQFILNEEPPLDPAQSAEAVKRGLFASAFYHTINAFKTIAIKSIVLVMTSLSFIEITQDYFYSVREKNRNANFWFKHFLAGILFAAEALAVTFFVTGTLVSALIAPAIFTAITGFKLLTSIIKTQYYGAQALHTLLTGDETYTQEYLHHKRLFKEHLKNTMIAAALFTGVFIGFLAPEIIPVLAIPATIALGLKWTACAILGSAGVLTLGKKLFHRNKKKENSLPTNNSLHEPLLTHHENFLSHKLKLSETVKAKYLKNNNLDHLIPSHIDDLLIKLEVTYEKDHTDRSYLFKLMTEETLRVPINGDKWKVLKMLKSLIDGENLNLKYQHVTYDNTVFGIAQYLNDTGALKSVLHSPFEDIGGMQKIFVLVDHYSKLHPEVLYQQASTLEEKESSQDSTDYLQKLLKDLKQENSKHLQLIAKKDHENRELREKFSKIKFECEYKAANSPKRLQISQFQRSNSMTEMNELSSMRKHQR